MRTDFAYIDDAVTATCERELAQPTISRDGLGAKATRVVAGFHLRDSSLEDKLVDEAVAKRRTSIEAFQRDRAAAVAVCAERGIKPLAVVPTTTWQRICEATGLYRLSPDANGTVFYSVRAFAGIKNERGMSGAEQVAWLAEHDWQSFLRRLFPDGVSFPSGYPATLVMPIPPDDVADALLKARGLELKVATVAEAISFKETPAQLYEHVAAIEEARARALRDDPIVYLDVGAATAIIAQFGDFPIEKQVVDRVLSAEALMRYFPDQIR